MDASEETEAHASSVDKKTEIDIFREYYTENDFFSSVEGILKIVSAIVCVVSSAVFLSGGSCAGVAGLGASSAGAALAGGAAAALLGAGVALRLPLYAPQVWLYTDIIVSTVMGVLLLLSGVLSMTLCDMSSAAVLDHIRGPIPIVSAGLMIASAVFTYVSIMRRWDAVRGPVMEPQRPPPHELEV